MDEYLVIIDREFVHPAEFRVTVFAVDISDLEKTLEIYKKKKIEYNMPSSKHNAAVGIAVNDVDHTVE